METFVGIYTGLFKALGLESDIKRFLFGSLVGFGGQLLLKPSISYKKDGSAKALGETLFPWYAWPLAGGAILGLFF